MKSKAISLIVTEALHRRLKRASDETGLKMKAIFQQALEAWLKELDDKRKAA